MNRVKKYAKKLSVPRVVARGPHRRIHTATPDSSTKQTSRTVRLPDKSVARVGISTTVGMSRAAVTTRAGAVESLTNTPVIIDRNTDMASIPVSACRKCTTPHPHSTLTKIPPVIDRVLRSRSRAGSWAPMACKIRVNRWVGMVSSRTPPRR